ncbi:MAG: sigma-70 family RNA polymerase sigma factor [Longimicrobiales bacterium]
MRIAGLAMAERDATAMPERHLAKPGFEEEALPWLEAVYRFGLRLTGGNESEAEDLTQETFLRAYRHWATYTPGTNVRSWLFTICRNVFLRSRERQDRRAETLESEIDVAVESLAASSVFDELRSNDPERIFFDSFLDAGIDRAIADLPDAFREAVILSDLEGLNYQEIAEVLDVPIGTVKSRLFRGRRLLAEALRDYGTEMGYIRGGAR